MVAIVLKFQCVFTAMSYLSIYYLISASLSKRCWHHLVLFCQMASESKDTSVAAVLPGVGDAVGVSSPKWYVAVVNNNSEKSVRDKLTSLGHTSYVATQEQVKIWKNGRRARSEQVVIRSVVFVRCSEPERRLIVSYPFIKRFMTDRAATGTGRLAVIPEPQMQTLRFILGNSDTPVSIEERAFRRGDRVRVVRGGLRGLEGEIVDLTGGDSELLIELSVLGCARLRIDRLNVEPSSML